MTLIHCPEGERLFKEMQAIHGVAAVVYENEITGQITEVVPPEWFAYRAHREICKECGMKDD